MTSLPFLSHQQITDFARKIANSSLLFCRQNKKDLYNLSGFWYIQSPYISSGDLWALRQKGCFSSTFTDIHYAINVLYDLLV